MNDEQIDRFYADLGQRLQRARSDADMTQGALGKLAGLTRSSVANVEAGRQRVPTHVLAAMADALQVEPQSLFSAALLNFEAGKQVVMLPLQAGDTSETRQFVESTLATVGVTARWAP